MTPRHVLVTNDDGIDATGLRLLAKTLQESNGHRVTVVAPSDQQSASSHSLTLTMPVRVLERGEDRYAVTGTPTDSVLVAIQKILVDDPPDFVLSGINHGPNMGEDVIYSGTVAAAMEGAILGYPSIALSLAAWHPRDFTGAVSFIQHWLPEIMEFPLEKGALLNVNIPEGPPESIKGIRVVKLGSRVYHDVITSQTDPRGRPYLWIGGNGPTWIDDPDTDFAAVQQGYAAVTPLTIDLSHHGLIARMSELNRRGTPGVPTPPGTGDPLA
jgi:5'-nucleotidase